MTSLLLHTVAQPTKWRFLPKNSSQLVIFVIWLAFTWVWGDKNHPNLIFKVNFLCHFDFVSFFSCFFTKDIVQIAWPRFFRKQLHSPPIEAFCDWTCVDHELTKITKISFSKSIFYVKNQFYNFDFCFC